MSLCDRPPFDQLALPRRATDATPHGDPRAEADMSDEGQTVDMELTIKIGVPFDIDDGEDPGALAGALAIDWQEDPASLIHVLTDALLADDFHLSVTPVTVL